MRTTLWTRECFQDFTSISITDDMWEDIKYRFTRSWILDCISQNCTETILDILREVIGDSDDEEEIQIEDPQPDLIAAEVEYNQTDAQTTEDSSQ